MFLKLAFAIVFTLFLNTFECDPARVRNSKYVAIYVRRLPRRLDVVENGGGAIRWRRNIPRESTKDNGRLILSVGVLGFWGPVLRSPGVLLLGFLVLGPCPGVLSLGS
jgi:hypothetical protein